MNTHPFRNEQVKSEYLQHYQSVLDLWPTPYEEKDINTSYGTTHVRINGPVDAPPLFLFHGAGTCSLQWLLNIEELSKHFRTYAMDGVINLGCVGRSVPSQPILDESNAAQWVDELLDGLNVHTAINLVGSSYGGWLASHYTLKRQEKIKKLLLIAPAGTLSPFNGSYSFKSLLIHFFPFHRVYQWYFKWVFKNLYNNDIDFFDKVIKDFILSSKSFIPINPNQLPKIKPLTDNELISLTKPVKIIMGDSDVVYSPMDTSKRVRTLNNTIEIEELENTGHDLLLTHTDYINASMVSYFQND
ncbi:alpha/beta hydrolase [Vibrio penaeicida]|uniref:alpha/beta fold hydrolase n=1 Tax=Vibrio penaeicida TaxID=104609 RepID=UPI00273649C1|nr:alpha/beta hydrolase [Vibrio penaeicida]MDP2574416.1 alpha/beta hydrolase [Vibrio penaeicida]